MPGSIPSGAATGPVRNLLRAEGLALFLVSMALYVHIGGSWLLFAILILAPDLSMLSYISGPRTGATAYNAVHSTIGPIALLGVGYFIGPPLLITIGLIWAAHVGIDRALGFGLKYPTGFGETHLGRLGRGISGHGQSNLQ